MFCVKCKALIVLLATILITSCTPESVTRTPPRPPTNPPAPTNPAAKPDLVLSVVHIEKYNDSYFDYQIVATLENVGAGAASGFDAGCTYKCPPGDTTISAGLDIVQGGYIAGNSSFTYKSPFHYQCAAKPPKLDMMCTVKSAAGSPTYSVNVTLP